MAVEVQSPGQLQEVLAILKRRLWQILLPGIVLGAIGMSFATIVPQTYKVLTRVEIRPVSLPLAGGGVDAQTVRKDLANAKFHVTSLARVRSVIEKLEWKDFTSLSRQMQHEYLTRVIGNIKVMTINAGSKSEGSSFLDIQYVDNDAERAEIFLNHLRDSYTTEVLDRFRNDARAHRATLHNQFSEAQNKYKEKEKQAAELKKRHGLSATQQAPGSGRQRDEDPVFRRLGDANAEYDRVQRDLAKAEVSLEVLREQLDEEPIEVPADTVFGGLDFTPQLIQIEDDILANQLKQEGLREAHSLYKAAELEIERLEAKRAALLEKTTQPDTQRRMVRNTRRDDLQAAIRDTELDIRKFQAQSQELLKNIDELGRKHLELQEIYREIKELDNEVTLAREAANEASKAYERQKRFVEFISQPHANPFELAMAATAPRLPEAPTGVILVLGALALGLGLGLASALVAEFGRNAYRSVGDISYAMAVPVLGAVNRIVTRGEARHTAIRRAMIGTSTAILVASILWVTWAYENKPRLLGPRLTQMIDGLSEGMR